MASPAPILNREYIRPGDRVCAAVSGGADSVALLLLLHAANRLPRNGLGVGISAVHVHHGLRGEEADADLLFVQGLCARLDVPLHVHHASVSARVAESRVGAGLGVGGTKIRRLETVEEAARALRYGFFRQLLAEGHADSVLTAHTLDDQAETVLMKLLRGAWTEGLSGIYPAVAAEDLPALDLPAPLGSSPGAHDVRVTAEESGENVEYWRANVPSVAKATLETGHFTAGLKSSPFKTATFSAASQAAPLGQTGFSAPSYGQPVSHPLKGRIVRPLLGVRRAELRAYLEACGQPWHEDSTNFDEAFTRNRLRHSVLPVLREENPAIDQALANLAVLAREDEARWQTELARVLPQLLLPGRPVRGGGRAVSTASGEASIAIDLDRLRALDCAMRRRVVRAAARQLGARLSFDETARLLELAGFAAEAALVGQQAVSVSASGTGKRPALHLAGGLRAERSPRELRLYRE